jgi:RNA polymerase sigma-70 factor, ECF subfamily
VRIVRRRPSCGKRPRSAEIVSAIHSCLTERIPGQTDTHLKDDTVKTSGQAEQPELTNADVLRLAQQGDAGAFERIDRLHSRKVYALCVRMTADRTEAEDLTQEVFLQLFRKIGTFRGESAFSTWLHRISVNIVLMRVRKKAKTETSLDAISNPTDQSSTPPQEFGGPDLQVNGVIDRITLQAAINELPRGYQAMFILRYIQGHKYNEIADILGCSAGNSKSQAYKARMRLRELLQKTVAGSALRRRQSKPSSPAADQVKYSLDHTGA